MIKLLATSIGAACMVLLAGCTFNRAIVNPGVAEMDTSFIKVGQTTPYQVLDKLGPPAPVSNNGENVRLVSDRHFRYLTLEQKTTRLLFGWYLILPFKWSDAQVIEELLIEFDDSGVVSGVFRTRRDTIWRPLGSEEDREAMQFNDLTARMK